MSHSELDMQHQQATGVKKLRFDNSVSTAMGGNSEALPVGAESNTTSARSALKPSPTSTNPSCRASSLRRPSEAPSTHSDAHVQLNPTAEVIEHDGSITTVNAETMEAARPVEAMEESAGEVANFLADVGAGVALAAAANLSMGSAGLSLGASLRTPTDVITTSAASASQTTSEDPCERFRSLLLQLSSLTLEHRPKDPEQYIIDYLHARLLSSTASARSLQTGGTTADEEEGATATTAVAAAAGTALPQENKETSSTTHFASLGDTVVERLTGNALLSDVGRAVVTRLAELLITAQPDDPEDFLWARLEARSFGEDATHNVTYSADGYPVVRPDDPTQVSLLKDIPAASPGYVVVAALLPLLFAKKPVDPISYLFYHIGSRARSSAAQSLHSSSRHMRGGDEEDEFNADSCTSGEFDEDSNSIAGDTTDLCSGGGSMLMAPLQRKGSLGSLFDNTTASVAPSLRRRSERADNARQRLSQGAATPRSGSTRRSMTGATRAPRDATAMQSLPKELAALSGAGSSSKRVSIAQQEGKPRSPMHVSHDSNAGAAVDIGSNATRTQRVSSFSAVSSTLHSAESDEQARVMNEFGILRLREELRLERLQHEIRTLTRECEYRKQMALLNKTDRMADRAAATAQEALEEALKYRAFLCAQIDQLEVEQQRQLQIISQQLANASPTLSAAAAPRISSPIAGYRLDAEAQLRYPEPQVPSELDILKKQVELLTMEQARARSMRYGVAPGFVTAAPQTTWYPSPVTGVSGSARASYAK
ncbi:hypothetical protein LSCM1_00966 [Leishmania martiniquensis]|uniref:Uncharacterized protein n=1 Tax=Leishmania martiniquensis TaxID=1580590 RepID=A0A836K859_9TRYP|nr:hypothetical protein LSCM1_00966 [Leishmania martiniquensis]